MKRKWITGHTSLLSAFAAALTLLMIACSSGPVGSHSDEQSSRRASELDGQSAPLSSLPTVDALSATETFMQLLAQPTKAGENVVLHVKLPPPSNRALQASMIRVIGDPKNPLVLFQSDALVKLGLLRSSPGSQFFSTFLEFDSKAFQARQAAENALSQGTFGKPTQQTLMFSGRHPVALRAGIHVDLKQFLGGVLIPLGPCFIRPISNLAAWGQSLLITDPQIVLDPARTWDPCTGAGTQGGSWTFAHLVREMANGSGTTPEAFVLAWLSRWLNDYTVNGDLVQNRRTQMFAQVVQPWASASGATASLSCTGLACSVSLTGTLNLDIAPFRLLAIVNRIDLGRTASGPSGYGGATTERPVDAGELRFVFGVVQPNPWGAGTQASCGLKRFSVIFEYGVPISGCANTVAWAQRWTALNGFGGFTAAYKTALEGITESVVLHGAAPSKGNQNALNQLRTNEIALGSSWELREFTLTDENTAAGTDTPSNGVLRAHTVAQTPNDAAFPTPNTTVDAFVQGVVLPSVPTPAGPLPSNCSASYVVPYFFTGAPFRGGNSLAPPGAWLTSSAVTPEQICARHQFSLNTCDGCHLSDTRTTFTHVKPDSGIPATLSGFLTGGGSGGSMWLAPDTQLGSPNWPFADLDRRFNRLYDIAFCTECGSRFGISAGFIDKIAAIAGLVPIDPIGPVSVNFKVGPITSIDLVSQIFAARAAFVDTTSVSDVPVDFVRSSAAMSD